METSTKETNLIIESVIDGKVHGLAIQEKKFKFAIKFTNKGNSPSGEFTVDKIQIQSAQGQNMVITEEKSFLIQKLNPSEEKVVQIGTYGTHMHGLANITIQIMPSQSNEQIVCHQKSSFTEEVSYIKTNGWIDFIYIKTRSEFQQEKNNSRMFFLSIVILVLTVVQVFNIFYQPSKDKYASRSAVITNNVQQKVIPTK